MGPRALIPPAASGSRAFRTTEGGQRTPLWKMSFHGVFPQFSNVTQQPNSARRPVVRRRHSSVRRRLWRIRLLPRRAWPNARRRYHPQLLERRTRLQALPPKYSMHHRDGWFRPTTGSPPPIGHRTRHGHLHLRVGNSGGERAPVGVGFGSHRHRPLRSRQWLPAVGHGRCRGSGRPRSAVWGGAPAYQANADRGAKSCRGDHSLPAVGCKLCMTPIYHATDRWTV